MFVVVVTAVVTAVVVATGPVDATWVSDGGSADSVDAHDVASDQQATVVMTKILCCFLTDA